jgi:PAS domain S-box-containing protein
LTAPITELAEGTRAVARGDYRRELPVTSHDELGVLVESFNDMTQRIAAARDEARRSQHQAESEQAYLKAVLGSLSSGVLTFDERLALRTANAAAEKILGADVHQVVDRPLDVVLERFPHLAEFAHTLRTRMATNEAAWEGEVAIVGPAGRRVLLCRGRSLPAPQEDHVGYVVVFDDITALIQAERDAAWREVARRIAHEIKNPLTPIQLSAERLRHKYLETLDPAGAEVLDRSTRTIIAQVEALKQMVKAFSEYARMPRMEPVALNLNALINEVLDLYRIGEHDIQFDVALDPAVGNIEADPARVRQVLHNLIRNALEAMRDTAIARVRVATHWYADGAERGVELRVEDSGPGIPDELMANLFEPYVTTKPRGAGLGLAIVKRIVDEHGGKLWAANCAGGGAGIYVRLPAESATKLSSVANKRTG